MLISTHVIWCTCAISLGPSSLHLGFEVFFTCTGLNRIFVLLWICLSSPLSLKSPFSYNDKYMPTVPWLQSEILFISPHPPSGANLQRELKIKNTIHSNYWIWCKAKISYMPEKEKKKKTVANCEGWRQPASLFSGWGLVQKSSSLCLIHTGLLVLNEAMADWSSVLHPWVTGLIVMWPVSFGLFRLILQPFPLHAVWPFIPSSQENTAWNQKTISQERGSLSFY